MSRSVGAVNGAEALDEEFRFGLELIIKGLSCIR
jgi:hypothetical protein